MKRTLYLGLDYANSIGVAINTSGIIDLENKRGTEMSGSVIVSPTGLATYYPPNDGRYKLVFRGKSPIYDEIGASNQWIQNTSYALPKAPILNSPDEAFIVQKDIGANFITLSWLPQCTAAVYWVVFAVNQDYTGIVVPVAYGSYCRFPVNFWGETEFYVYGVNAGGLSGASSNRIEINLPRVKNRIFIIGNDVDKEYFLPHNNNTNIIVTKVYNAVTEELLTSGFSLSTIDLNTEKIEFPDAVSKDSIKVIIDNTWSSGNMDTDVYDPDGSGVVDTAEYIDGGEW
jgi:hypothetical protein